MVTSKGNAQAKRKPRELQVYKAWCKRCGICVAFCPKGALIRDPEGFPQWKDQTSCVACRMCEYRCPDFAVEVITEDERDAREE